MAKKDAKIVAQQLGISEQDAEGRIVAEILRNSDKQTADASGGVHDWEVRSIVGCQNLNCDGYKSEPQYANHSYNSQYIAGNQQAYDAGQKQLGTGLTDAGLRDQNIMYERTGKAALAVAACVASGGVACNAAATGLGITALTNYATDKPVTTAETIGGFIGGGIGEIYGANLNAWAGDAGGWMAKAVLGVTKFAPTYAGKQVGIPAGNATGLGGSVDPLFDPATNSWWGFKNTMENLQGAKKMSLSVGVVLITLTCMFATWFMFGVSAESSKKKRIIYWLESTIFLWIALILWVSYKEPDISFVIAAVVSLVFSALANLLRSQWVFMLP